MIPLEKLIEINPELVKPGLKLYLDGVEREDFAREIKYIDIPNKRILIGRPGTGYWKKRPKDEVGTGNWKFSTERNYFVKVIIEGFEL